MKSPWRLILGAFLAVALVGVWLSIVDVGSMAEAFARVDAAGLIPLGLLFLTVYFLRTLRWKIILSPFVRIGAFDSFKLGMINYLINFLVPIHAGEVAKCVLLKRMKGTPVSRSLVTAYVDKLTDLVPVFLLPVAAPFLSRQVNSVIYLISGAVFVGLAVFVAFLVSAARKKETTLALLEKGLFFLPRKYKERLGRFSAMFSEAVATLPLLSGRLLEIAGLTLLALALHCLYLWLFFRLFGLTVPALAVLVGYLMLNASFILPAPPGFSGSLELTFLFIFSYLFQQDKNIVSAVAASSHLFAASLFGLTGLACVTLVGVKLSSLFKLKP